MYVWAKRKEARSDEATRVEFWLGIFVSSKFWRTEVRTMYVFNNKRKETELATKEFNWNGWGGALRRVACRLFWVFVVCL